jgi:hypothetical protein
MSIIVKLISLIANKFKQLLHKTVNKMHTYIIYDVRT